MLKIKNIYANFNYCNNNNSNNKSQVRLKTMYKVAASLSPFSLFLLLSISLFLFPSSLLLSQLGENFTPFAMRLTAVPPCLPHFLSPSLSLSSLYIYISLPPALAISSAWAHYVCSSTQIMGNYLACVSFCSLFFRPARCLVPPLSLPANAYANFLPLPTSPSLPPTPNPLSNAF